MVYDSKAVTIEEWSWLLSCQWKLKSEGWERLPDPNNPNKPLPPIYGIIYLRKGMQ